MHMSAISELLAEVPKPPGEGLPPGLADADLQAFSERTGIPLPPDFAQWLKFSNGPCVGPGGVFGIGTSRSALDIESYLTIYPAWKLKKWIPVAGDGCGNYYLLATQGEFGPGFPVFFVDTSASSNSPAYIAASDIEHFLIFLLEKELGRTRWPFDRATVAEQDPMVFHFQKVPLPWASG